MKVILSVIFITIVLDGAVYTITHNMSISQYVTGFSKGSCTHSYEYLEITF